MGQKHRWELITCDWCSKWGSVMWGWALSLCGVWCSLQQQSIRMELNSRTCSWCLLKNPPENWLLVGRNPHTLLGEQKPQKYSVLRESRRKKLFFSRGKFHIFHQIFSEVYDPQIVKAHCPNIYLSWHDGLQSLPYCVQFCHSFLQVSAWPLGARHCLWALETRQKKTPSLT